MDGGLWVRALDLPVQATAVSFGIATAGQGCKLLFFYYGKPRQALAGQGCELWDCHCRPRLQASGLPLQAKAMSFCFATADQGCKFWDCQCRPRLQASGLLVQAIAASFCFLLCKLWQAKAASFCFFLLWQADASFGRPMLWASVCQCRPRLQALGLPLQAMAVSFCLGTNPFPIAIRAHAKTNPRCCTRKIPQEAVHAP